MMGQPCRFLPSHFSRTAKFREVMRSVPTEKTVKRGVDNGYWSGGRHLGTNGYWRVLVGGVYRLEHRVIMERIVGRPLLRSEVVHHRNSVCTDNRPENLELLTGGQAEHMRKHLTPDEARRRGSKGGWARRAALAALATTKGDANG